MSKLSHPSANNILLEELCWKPVKGAASGNGHPPMLQCYLDGRLGDPSTVAGQMMERLRDAALKLGEDEPVLSREPINCIGFRMRPGLERDPKGYETPPSQRIKVSSHVLHEARQELRAERKRGYAMQPQFRRMAEKGAIAETIIRKNHLWHGDGEVQVDLREFMMDDSGIERIAESIMRILGNVAREGDQPPPVQDGAVIKVAADVRLEAALRLAELALQRSQSL